MNIQQLIDDLKQQGLENEQILQSLEQMVQEGKIQPEDLEQAKQLLMGGEQPPQDDPAKEKEEAGKLFGLNLI